MKKITVDEMKDIELSIMCEIDRVCRESGITYFLGYGSLLGAIRHGGFIPWDDDMDVVMMRDDYEQFIRVFESAKQKNHMKVVSYRDKSAANAFIKVVDTTTWVKERYAEDEHGSGVWVDIFPLDEIPDMDYMKLFRKCSRYSAMRYLSVTDASTGSSALIRLGKKIACPFFKKAGPYCFAESLDRAAMSFKGRGFSNVADLLGEAKTEQIMDKNLFVPVEWEFEGHSFFIPKHYDEVLTIVYGDWRTPPSEGDRETHSCEVYRL